MSRYISLLRFTEKGAAQLRQSTRRAHAFAKAAAKAGVRVESQYWTMGSHDGVLVLSADREEKALHYLGLLSAAGFVRTETMRAFVDAEFEKILKSR